MEFVVVSGLSGSGKSTALRALEDAGFFAADNVPPELWERLYVLAETQHLEKVAVCTDARTRAFLGDLPSYWLRLRARGQVRLIYLEANDEVLLSRYNLTRRTHPLGEASLTTDFRQERELLGVLRERADTIIDTTALTARTLAERIMDLVQGGRSFEVRLVSFGFKHAPPRDADLVLDVRSLPNPYYDPELRHRTGLEADVAERVFSQGDAYYLQVRDFVRTSATRAREVGRRTYNVAIGCTGGHHRSVAVAERLARDLTDLGARVVEHRDIGKGDSA